MLHGAGHEGTVSLRPTMMTELALPVLQILPSCDETMALSLMAAVLCFEGFQPQ